MSAAITTHRLELGRRAGQIVTLALEQHADVLTAGEVAALGRRVFRAEPVDYRPRESLLEAVTAAGVYLNRLRPTEDWRYIGAEVRCGACRFDLVWAHPQHGHLIDELKLGIGRGGELAVRDQIDSYLVAGQQRWPDFLGVRLCAVHEPAASRLYLPENRRSALVAASPLARELAPR